MTQKTELRYAIGLTSGFLILGSLTAFNHEMWRDEMQAWLLARDSASVFELFAHLKYEGHPGLWHLCLMPLSRITASPIIMQVFHLLIACVTVYLFARYAPFNWLQKFLFSFGYFALYEYAIVARNYALGMLLIVLFCVLFRERYKRPLWIGGILFLLAHTSVHALIVSIGIGFALFCEYFLMKSARLQTAPTDNTRVWFSFALIGIGILTSVLQLKPPVDTGFAVGWKFDYETHHLFKVIKLISRAYLPIPKQTLHFWNSHQLEAYPFFQNFQMPLCFLLIFCSVLFLYKRPTALLIYLTSTFGLLAFFYVKYYGSIRHHGFLFLTFVMVVWIYRESARLQTAPTDNTPDTVGALFKRALKSARLQTAPTHLCAVTNRAYRKGTRTVGALFKRAQKTARLQTATTEEDTPSTVGALFKRALKSARLQTAPTDNTPDTVGALFKRAQKTARLQTAPTGREGNAPTGREGNAPTGKEGTAPTEREGTAPTGKEGTLWERAFSILFTLILVCHFIGGIIAIRMDNRYIFSCGKQTAAAIKAQGMQEMPMVGDTDFAVSTVVGYLERAAIYYPRGSRFGSFIRWDDARTAEVPTADVLEAAKTLSMETSQAVLIILNRAVGARLQERYRLIDVARFTGSTISDEAFYLYRMPAP